tara:strand:- start:1237 stop:1593 length:357 start_codon:yes stop_codon:yes gene_type:complete
MPKYKDALRILKQRIEFFEGRLLEAGGKELMYRVLASEPELDMLAYIESQYEPTTYAYKPGQYVDYITPEIAFFIRHIYTKLTNKNAQPEDGQQNKPQAGKDRISPRRGEPARKRLKT